MTAPRKKSITARELAAKLMTHPDAEVTLRGNWGENGYGHNAAPSFIPTVDFQHVAYMGCPNPEQVGRPVFTLVKGEQL